MTDQDPSGDSAAPAESPAESPAEGSAKTEKTQPSAPTPAPAGTFGATRGSGLARGKRAAAAAAPAAKASTGEYQPTAVQLITHKKEYQNPFGGDSTAPAAEPTPEVAVPVEQPQAAPAPAPEPQAMAPKAPAEQAPIEPVAAPLAPAPAEEPAPKAELKILPPAEVRRTALHWEKPAPGGREPAAGGYPPRQPRDDRRDGRPSFRPDFQRPREPGRPSSYEPAAKPKKGFFAWLKGLFGGQKDSSESGSPRGGEFDRDGHRHSRRHRGGRGRFDGPRPEGQQDARPPQDGSQAHPERGPYREGEQRRHRHRGGRGRSRGGPRPEGQQGGGFI